MLDSGELLTGVPSVTSDTTGLTIGSVTLSIETLTINGKSVAAGQAVQFNVAGGVDGVDYLLQITATTDSSPAQTLSGFARLIVRDQT